MALVQEHQRVLGQVVGQRRGRRPGRRAREMAGVVLDAFAMADLAEHFQVEAGALLQPLGLHQLAVRDQLLQPLRQLDLDGLHRGHHFLARRHVVAGRVHREARDLLADAAGQRVEQLQRFDLVVEQLDADRQLAVLRGKDVDGVAAHAEGSAREILLVAVVLHADQLRDDVALADLVAHPRDEPHLGVVLGRADAINRAHRRHDHRVAPLQHALGGRQPHLLYVFVDRAVLLDEQVALRDVGLGLVVVVVADEVLDGVVREELAKLAVQLRGQGLVGGEDDGRPPEPGDDVGHGEGLARAGDAQQRLEDFAVAHALDQLLDGGRLVARGRVRQEQLERRIREGDELPLLRFGYGFRSLWHGLRRGPRWSDGKIAGNRTAYSMTGTLCY